MLNIQKNLARDLLASTLADRFDITDSGLVFPRESVKVAGLYTPTVDGIVQSSRNLVTKEGLLHLLNVALGSTPKPAGYFVALFSGSTAPASNWAASNFASVAGEIVSSSEGYTLATRIPWTSTNASADTHIDNYASEVEVTFATSATVNVTGSALLTASAKGATTGVLVSATLYDAPYTFQNGNTFRVGYRLEMTV
ncbi:hypothetical protein D8I35_05260 [Corticibacter populi]|uniref:Uncharacterized protein n=1 Tax=Corticibacter populi TaxID=1550736 RepID=A0A3M6QZP7_9BURK|nr:hypothetical protein [Corticibacter populi]RMX08487.1 hypothetical protein D8I35_05260 [Corticibacter populi]RZS35800.1 hypothetical protein EV687_0879 [Corticibacter populi]